MIVPPHHRLRLASDVLLGLLLALLLSTAHSPPMYAEPEDPHPAVLPAQDAPLIPPDFSADELAPGPTDAVPPTPQLIGGSRWASVYGWQLHNPDPASIFRSIDIAAERGVTHLQLSHQIVHQAEDLFVRPRLPDLLRQVVRYAHNKGIKVFLWTREFHGGPSYLAERPDMDSSRFWDWIRSKYQRVYDIVPEVDGLVLTLYEVDVTIYIDSHVSSRMSAPERVSRLLTIMEEVGRERGKTLIVRTFVGRPEHLAVVAEGIRRSPPSVAVMVKDVPQDYWWRHPFAPELGAFPERQQIVELDLAHEYFGQSLLPFVYPAHIARRLDWARRAGANGVVARVEREGRSVLGTLSELNLYVLERLLEEPDRPLDEVWQEIVQSRLDPTGRLAVVLPRTEEVVEKTFLVKGFYFLNNHSRVPELRYAHFRLWDNYALAWDASLGDAHRALLRPDMRVYSDVIAEKNEAVLLAEQNLRDVQALRNELPPSVYAQLVEELTRELDAARLWRAIADAYFAHSLCRMQRYSYERRVFADQRIRAMLEVAEDIKRRYGPDHWLLSSKRTRTLADQMFDTLCR